MRPILGRFTAVWQKRSVQPKSCNTAPLCALLMGAFALAIMGQLSAQTNPQELAKSNPNVCKPESSDGDICPADDRGKAEPNEAPRPDGEPPSVAVKPRDSGVMGSRFTVAMKMSSLGAGGDVAVRIHRKLNIRAGVNGFNYHRTVSDGGVNYDAALRMRSIQTVVDWFPFAKIFHLSPGIAVYNGNRVVANAIFPINKPQSAAGESFISSTKDPLIATATSSMRRVAPLVLFGFGNLVPKTRHIAFGSDFGIIFQGTPNAVINVAGSACDLTGAHCQKVATDKDLKADLESGERTMQQDLRFMKFYPVLSFSIGYHF